MARLVLPSRLELKRPEGSSNEAPLAKVIFTTLLYVSPVQMIPACDHTGTPRHFHSSTTSGVGLLDQLSDPSERLAPPITQLLDSRIDQLRGKVSAFSFLRAALALLHGRCRFSSWQISAASVIGAKADIDGLLHLKVRVW